MPLRGTPSWSRRRFLTVAGAAGTLAIARRAWSARQADFALSRFSAEVTPPMGHALMGGGISPASSVADPLHAQGIVLLGADQPLVICAVDWCEIRNDAYSRWQELLGKAAGTSPDRVLVASVHQHDAPVADLEAERILREFKSPASVCDPEFHERAVRGVAAAVSASLKDRAPITHFGVGAGQVEQVASNRRYHAPDGTLRFDRTSACRDPVARAAELGTIDPWLKSLSFWNGDSPLAVVHAYATHPMSYYGRGEVSDDFVGLARRTRAAEQPGVQQIYFSGASGNVTAGKHNDGAPENRALLAQRLANGMRAAWEKTDRAPLESISLRRSEVNFAPRSSPGFTQEDLERRLREPARPFEHCLAAMGLSWRRRAAAGRAIDVSALDLGGAKLLFLPGESYVEFQLAAQQHAPENFVMTAGYAECATGYVPIERAWQEGDTNLGDWCWVDPGAEEKLLSALRKIL